MITVLLFGFLISVFGMNVNAQNIDIAATDYYNEDKKDFSVPETLSSTSLQAVGSELKVMFPFIIVPLHSKATFFSSITSFLFVNTKVMVLGYENDYTKVRIKGSETEGYIFQQFLSKDKSLLIKPYSNIWVGKSKSILKDYNNPEFFLWSVSQDGIISIDKQTGTVIALKPGTVKVTAKYNGKTNECVVTSINPWKETETSVAEKDVVLKATPQNSELSPTGKINKGSKLIAHGDMADGNGWIYVSDKDEKIWGYIELSDFPGIDYLFTEYHYYDKGYDIRFKNVYNKSASDNIYAYASVMNDVMMDLFKLKISPYVYAYTSPADSCKIWQDGSVSFDNLASSCPKTGKHNSESCLTTGSLRNAMYNNGNGAGNDFMAKAVWTGHIMDGHAMSNSQRNPTYILVFTTGNTVDKSTNKNKSDYMVRSRSIYELMHETGHQFELHDHYCYGINPSTGVCGNNYCDTCVDNKSTAPFCVMNKPFDIQEYDTDEIFCSECKKTIEDHLKNHH